MKRQVIAVLCMVLVLTGILGMWVSAEQTNERYYVGYAKKDVNAWVDPTNPSCDNLVDIPLSGYGNSTERLATGMTDDNGDGVVDEKDGLFTTCTSVTDAYGKTVMYITIDTIGAYSNLVSDLRKAIIAELGSNVISIGDIMVSASHTHEGPDYGTCRSAQTGSAWRKYYNYALAQMTDAAVEAYNNRSEAVMTKGEVDASESSGYQLNFVRHYNVIEEERSEIVSSIFTPWSESKRYVAGDNFGGTRIIKEEATSRRRVENVSEANDTMYLTQFAPVNGEAPIVLANWRAHASMNGGSTNTVISSDYINAFRHYMEKNGYRIAFFQSAAGNINARHSNEVVWRDADVSQTVVNPTDANKYGYLLTMVALDCLENHMTQELTPGKIRTLQTVFQGEIMEDSAGLQAAADQYYADVAAGKTTSFPYKYKHTDGKTYILNSAYHADNIRTRRTYADSTTFGNLELNVIALGDSVMFLTAPNELFDRYSLEATLEDTSDNDWLDLVNNETYGTPILLGYSNDSRGYVPNALAYTYNEGSSDYGVGSYEANTTRFAPGEGERIIATYGEMITLALGNHETRTCEVCGKETEWTPLTAAQAGVKELSGGHYYLTEDFPVSKSAQKKLVGSDPVCLDLNGHTMETKGRTFSIPKNTKLNLMDTAGGGKVISYSGNNNVGGGVVSISANGNFNLYGGTLQFIRSEEGINPGYETAAGGVVNVQGSGKFTMYDGVLIGGQLGMSGNDASGDPILSADNGCGATVRVISGGYFYLYGGTVKAGKAADGGKGDCVFLASKNSRMYLSGDAQVDNIYFDYVSGSNLYIKGTYTGSAVLEFNPDIQLVENLDIGNGTGSPDITYADLTCLNNDELNVILSGTNLRLSFYKPNTVAAIHNGEKVSSFASLQEAVEAYSQGYIKLLADEDKAVDITKDIYLDVNGYKVSGAVTVYDGYTLYGMDCQTDDFKATDSKGYGMLMDVTCKGTGAVTGVAKDCELTEDGYMMAVEDNHISFHRVKLTIYAMDLRAVDAGLYYRSRIEGDEVVARTAAQYGVALSVVAAPTAENLKQDCEISAFSKFNTSGAVNEDNVMGTLLSGILKEDNTQEDNIRNGGMPVYGRAYVLSNSGQYVFGETVTRTLKQQLEDVDSLWDTLSGKQRQSVLGMYNTYTAVMDGWNIPNIKKAAGDLEDSVLKVLVIGNGHSMDAAELLYDVFQAENPSQSVVLGVLSADGADMAEHSLNATKDLCAYNYYKNTGTWAVQENAALTDALADEQWDVIVLQQMNYKAGLAGEYVSTYFSQIISTIRTHQEAEPKLAWHMVWANPEGEYLDGAAREDWKALHENWYAGADGMYDSSVMYEKIAGCTQKQIMTNKEISLVIPAATAIEYAQQVLGRTYSQVYRDETHLSDYGQLIAAYVWYAQLMGLDSVSGVNLEQIAGGVNVTEDMKQDIMACVNWALANPCALPVM